LPLRLDLIQTVAFAGILLFVGYGVRNIVPGLARVNVPAPVCGGLPIAAILALLYFNGIQPLAFDTTLQTPLQTPFLRRSVSARAWHCWYAAASWS
jgi:ESS family glutamate:Na+ symporter